MAKNRNFQAAPISIRNFSGLVKEVEALQTDAQNAMQQALREARRNTIKTVAAAVGTQYNVKTSEITGGKIVAVRTEVESADSIKFNFKGRLLTPLHFKGFSPRKPAPLLDKRQMIPGEKIAFKGSSGSPVGMVRTRKPYKVKVEIKKDQRKQLRGEFPTSPFIAPAAKGSSTHIPFQRTNGGKYSVDAIKTLSVPQMITSDKVADIIQTQLKAEISRNIDKQFQKI